jgi:predicted MFS family arabinose efflux permease
MVSAGLFFMGQFVLFTYLRPFLENVTRVDVSLLSMMLLVIGLAGFIGTVIIGSVLKSGLYRVVIAIPLLMAMIAVALIGLGSSLIATFVLLGWWGLIATAAPVGWWSWLARTLPDDAEAGGGLMVAVVQLSIAAGSTVGGLLFDGSGYRLTFLASAVLPVLAALMTWLTSRQKG